MTKGRKTGREKLTGEIADHAARARFVFKAEVVKSGRTLTFCEANAFAEHEGKTMLIATMTGTLMAMLPRAAA